MMKKILVVCMYFFSVSAFACGNSLPTNDPNFCHSFQEVAKCHCNARGVPGYCRDMPTIYSSMKAIFGSLEAACKFQHDVSPQECVNDWNCYFTGGKDSLGRKCSSTMAKCQ
jgi:hypothetical protein